VSIPRLSLKTVSFVSRLNRYQSTGSGESRTQPNVGLTAILAKDTNPTGVGTSLR
jgi:hypothetical protein